MNVPAFNYWAALVSTTKTLAHLYQSFHWQTSGAMFYGDHLLYDKLYTKVNDEVDGIAERAIGLMNNPKVVNPLAIAMHQSFMVEFLLPRGELTTEDMPLVLFKAERHYVEFLDEMMKALESQAASSDSDNVYNGGVEDLLQSLTSAHQENMYLLQQRIGNPVKVFQA